MRTEAQFHSYQVLLNFWWITIIHLTKLYDKAYLFKINKIKNKKNTMYLF